MNKNDKSSVALFSAMLAARHAKPHFRSYIYVSLLHVAAGRSCPQSAAGYRCARSRLSRSAICCSSVPELQDALVLSAEVARTFRGDGRVRPARLRSVPTRTAARSPLGAGRRGQPAAPTAPARRRGNEPEPGPSPVTGRDGEAGARALCPSPIRDPAPGSGLDAAAAPATLT